MEEKNKIKKAEIMKKQKADLSGFSSSRNQPAVITEPGGSLDAENVCGADAGSFLGGASDLDR